MKEILTPTETSAFSTFQQLCAKQGLLAKQPDGLGREDVSDGIHDDVTLLRFLRARKWNPSEALNQYREARTFSTEKDVPRLYDSISVDDYEDTRRLYPHWTGRRDKRGLPIMMIDTAHLDNAAINHWRETRALPDGPDMAQRACVFHDTLTRFVLPLCTAMRDRPDNENPVTHSVYLVDVSSISLKQAWDLKDFAQDISWILATCYPETIKYIFACNVPSYFSMLWNVLKNFVDPATAEKIVVLRPSDVYRTLSTYIEHRDIPVQLGGGFTFENGMLPEVDESVCKSLWGESPSTSGGAKRSLPPGPLKWIQDGEDGKRKIVATGRIGGVQRSKEVAVLDVHASSCVDTLDA